MKQTAALAAIILILSVAACGPAPAGPDTPGQDQVLVLKGLSDQPLEITAAEVKELEQISGTARTISSSGEESQRAYTGVKVETILAKFGLDMVGVTALAVNAGDGYGVEIPQQLLETRDIILAWEIDGAPLEEKDAPFRVVVPEERSLYWVRNVTELVFVRGDPAQEVKVTQVKFFENLQPSLTPGVFPYYGSEDKAFDISALVGNVPQVTLVARDGLTKHQNLKADLTYYIKAEGEDAPLFISEDIPKGMYVKTLGLLVYGDKAVVFANSFAQGSKVNMKDVLDFLAPYAGEGELTLSLSDGDIIDSIDGLAELQLIISQQGVVLE